MFIAEIVGNSLTSLWISFTAVTRDGTVMEKFWKLYEKIVFEYDVTNLARFRNVIFVLINCESGRIFLHNRLLFVYICGTIELIMFTEVFRKQL